MTHLPPRVHTSVKSRRSNRYIEVTTLSVEPWSLPWHALQRTLANGLGAEAAIYSPAGRRGAEAPSLAAEAGSWLSRGGVEAAAAHR